MANQKSFNFFLSVFFIEMSPSQPTIHVLIADSQFLITESLKHILQDDMRFHVSNVVMEKRELIKELAKEDISLLIIDPSFIELTSFSELKEIKSSYPCLQLLVITNGLTRNEILELNNLGINDIILKSAGRDDIFEALTATLKGKKYYSNELLDLLFEQGEKKGTGEESGILTVSEMEIVRLISEGFTTKEIASRKYISFHTVITHRKNIFRKLGVSSVSELIMYALKAGWINLIEYHI
jgi:DNA-binding NarL/FixJ family response regulator